MILGRLDCRTGLGDAGLPDAALTARRSWAPVVTTGHAAPRVAIPANLRLRSGAGHVYETPSGLPFINNASTEHGIDHVQAHLAPGPGRHRVFNVGSPAELIALLDEAAATLTPAQRQEFNGLVPLRRAVGLAPNETCLHLVIHDGVVTTAYPAVPAAARSLG